MVELEEWFGEFRYYKSEVFYKGFSIKRVSGEEEGLVLYDTRTNDFYSEVKDSDLEMFREHGFIKGADLIMYYRDCTRCNNYMDEILRIVGVKASCVKRRVENPKFFDKKTRNLQSNINNILTEYYLVKSRKTQTENKYNLNP